MAANSWGMIHSCPCFKASTGVIAHRCLPGLCALRKRKRPAEQVVVFLVEYLLCSFLPLGSLETLAHRAGAATSLGRAAASALAGTTAHSRVSGPEPRGRRAGFPPQGTGCAPLSLCLPLCPFRPPGCSCHGLPRMGSDFPRKARLAPRSSSLQSLWQEGGFCPPLTQEQPWVPTALVHPGQCQEHSSSVAGPLATSLAPASFPPTQPARSPSSAGGHPAAVCSGDEQSTAGQQAFPSAGRPGSCGQNPGHNESSPCRRFAQKSDDGLLPNWGQCVLLHVSSSGTATHFPKDKL